MKMGERELFGESALSGEGEQKRQATIVAEGAAVAVLKLTREDFTSTLGDLTDLFRRNFNKKVRRAVTVCD